MCIRDRRLTVDVEQRDLPAVGEKTLHCSKTDATRATRHQRCLLYTSDAADERSSVDLGGRRIIKKKKQQVSERAYMRKQKDETEATKKDKRE